MKKLLLIVAFLGFSSTLFSQEYAIDKGASFLSGSGGFSITKYTNSSSSNIIQFSLSASDNYFIAKGLFIGAVSGFGFSSQKDVSHSYSINLGPQIGYAIGNIDSEVFPYVSAGFRYGGSIHYQEIIYSGSNEWVSSYTYTAGIGAIIPVKQHIGLIVRCTYTYSTSKNDYVNTDVGNFVIGFGMTGLFYKSKE